MIRKRRAKWVPKGDPLARLRFIEQSVWAGDLSSADSADADERTRLNFRTNTCILDRGMRQATDGEDMRLRRFTSICLALPEATRELMGRHASFRVRKRIFAYFLDDHHGDGIVGINCKVLPGDNRALIASHPTKFYMPAYIGPRGWVGMRLDNGKVDWDEVEELVTHSYRLVAPKTAGRSH